jgi:hypothetical protein
MMVTGEISETLVFNSTLPWLMAQEDLSTYYVFYFNEVHPSGSGISNLLIQLN